MVVNNPYKFRVEVGDLHPATFYSVCVSAYSKDLTSRCSKIITKKTHESGRWMPHVSEMANLASRLGQIGPKWDTSGTF